MPVTKSELIEQLSESLKLPKGKAELVVNVMFDAMVGALERGERIEIRGFGSFQVNRRPPRMGRNPRSGEAVAIPSKRVPHFKPGKALREAVDQRTAEMEDKG